MFLRTCFKIAKNTYTLKNNIQLQNTRFILANNELKLSVRVLSTSNIDSSRPSYAQQPHIRRRIYYGVLTPQIKAVKVFSLSSSIVGLIAQPFLYNEIASMGNISIIVAVYSFIGFFTFVTPLLLHTITKKYATQLDHIPDKDTYVATTINFLCMSKETEFKLEDVKVPDVPGMFTTLIAKGKAIFLDPKFFESHDHYARLMGYDKPIDFKLYESNANSSGTPEDSDVKHKS